MNNKHLVPDTGINIGAIEKLYYAGLADYVIGQRLGTSANAVRSWRKFRNLPANKSGRPKQILQSGESITTLRGYTLPKDLFTRLDVGIKKRARSIDEASAFKLYSLGYNDEAIGFVLEVSPSTVRSWRTRYQLSPVHNITRTMAREQNKFHKIATAELLEPTEDPESLYFCTDTLEQICGKTPLEEEYNHER